VSYVSQRLAQLNSERRAAGIWSAVAEYSASNETTRTSNTFTTEQVKSSDSASDFMRETPISNLGRCIHYPDTNLRGFT